MTLAIASLCVTGFAGRPLPVPPLLAAYGAALAVLASFAILVRVRGRSGGRGRALPQWVVGLVDSRTTRRTLRALGLGLLAVTLLAAWVGSRDPAANPVPTWTYVWFWVGLAPLSAVFGPIWRLLNPLRPLANGLRAVIPLRAALPAGVGYWPAVVGLIAFVWIELVHDRATDPTTIAVFISAYTAVHVLAGAVLGPSWFDKADGFEAASNLLGRLSPLSRADDGRLVIRSPRASLATTSDAAWRAPGLITLVAVLIGSTAYDGISRTDWWTQRMIEHANSPGTGTLLETAALCATIALVQMLYVAALRSTHDIGWRHDLEGSLVYSLLPISLGYTIAHYTWYLVYQGQAGFLLASDPFGLGWDLFGVKDQAIDSAVIRPSTLAIIQITAIVAGHALGALVAHDRVAQHVPARSRRAVETPLVALMVALTVGGVALVANA